MSDESPATDFRRLPEPIALDDVVTEHPASPPPDPEMDRDPNHEWMLKYG